MASTTRLAAISTLRPPALLPGSGETVVFELAIAVVGHLPLVRVPAFLFQPMQGRIE